MASCWTNLRTQEPLHADDVMESAVVSCMAIIMMYANEQADEEMVFLTRKGKLNSEMMRREQRR